MPHVLIIDDDAKVREPLRVALELFKVRVSKCTDSTAGIKQYMSERPDVTVCSLSLRAGTGFAIIHQLLKLDPTARIVALEDVGQISTDNANWPAISFGQVTFVPNPVTSSFLSAAVGQIVAIAAKVSPATA